ncbi:hypothetical protein CAOG_08476 [Capsaspora owczarzaki ATCC 30864]|uniref:PNPLA domain-containing protein n=1 Tax=Capsaspora owczarzaki (strain ATCC 30864) TaxID=595528 RepID=A0A0D2VIA7_CAPO3|nr:hypothetical protein CAOG_08476 [Capsaspora owczarzaki ATCC 30864]KJE89682.1 hypothetical protein CAOG_008476 [Capsaspora owczarzaki ATCC 30864]|eukprot:XP_011270048.1 hypothetical protein CAOG_08476 [Capsaspora owczarzaki ATCC 30864]
MAAAASSSSFSSLWTQLSEQVPRWPAALTFRRTTTTTTTTTTADPTRTTTTTTTAAQGAAVADAAGAAGPSSLPRAAAAAAASDASARHAQQPPTHTEAAATAHNATSSNSSSRGTRGRDSHPPRHHHHRLNEPRRGFRATLARLDAVQLVLHLAQVLLALLRWVFFIGVRTPLRSVLAWIRPPNHRARVLFQEAMKQSASFAEWHAIAAEYDKLEGNDAWTISDHSSALFDVHIVRIRLGQLRAARLSGDLQQMVFLLRAGLQRNYGGIDNPELFTQSFVGTKQLIQEYNDEMVKQLLDICEAQHPSFDYITKERFFHDARQAFGRSALLLSGGASLGMIHFGVVKTLFQFNLLPRIISGGSIGAIVAAFLGTHTDAELPGFFEPNAINFRAFDRLGHGSARRKITRLLTQGVLMDASKLEDFVRSNIGDVTFQEAYRRTGRVINITVASTTRHEMPRLLNYLTAPNVCIWSAATASCASPFLYAPADLQAKNQNGDIVLWNPSSHKWGDGTLENDLPMARLSELFNVNQFIVSQVNPHVVPFMRSTKKSFSSSVWREWGKAILLSEIKHRVIQLVELGLFPKMFQPMLTQRYEGDITIVPDLGLLDLAKVLGNPNEKDLQHYLRLGERCTWPYIPIIQNRLQVELTLDACLQQVRAERKGLAGQLVGDVRHRNAASHSGLPVHPRVLARRPTM